MAVSSVNSTRTPSTTNGENGEKPMKRDNHNPDNRCWGCGKKIKSPQYWVSERVQDWGLPTSDYIQNPIHKSCYDELDGDTTIHFINGIESP